MKKYSLLVSLVFLMGFVSASISSTTEFTNPSYPNQKAYKVTYNIQQPGWYLLPQQNSLASFSQDTDFLGFYKSVDYMYAFSPFTKEYVRCVEKPNSNPLVCDRSELYDLSEGDFQSLTEESFVQNYMIYTAISADWHYYSKPIALTESGEIPLTVSYEYHPYMLREVEGDDMGLLGIKLKQGWNMIIYPPYAAYAGYARQNDFMVGEDCDIQKLYVWGDETQQWSAPFSDSDITNKQYLRGELMDAGDGLSGKGMAIRVATDCKLFSKISGSVSPPPLPQPSDNCIDTDGGVNYMVKGILTINKETSTEDMVYAPGRYEDKCLGDQLEEFYCTNRGMGSVIYQCENVCNNGSC